jgi:hypothetical protein
MSGVRRLEEEGGGREGGRELWMEGNPWEDQWGVETSDKREGEREKRREGGVGGERVFIDNHEVTAGR